MKNFFKSLAVVIATLGLTYSIVGAATVAFPTSGGTGTSTAPANLQFLMGTTTGKYQFVTGNQPSGPILLDANGNATATVIPRLDYLSHLSSIVLQQGEMALATDTNGLYIGDGTTAGGTWVNPWKASSTKTYFTAGNVGIGTNNPTNTLTVKGTYNIGDLSSLLGGAILSSDGNGLTFTTNAYADGLFTAVNGVVTMGDGLGDENNTYVQVDDPAGVITISPSNFAQIPLGHDLALGTTSPSATLSIKAFGGSGRMAAFSDSSNIEKFTVTNAGNIGLGTTSPFSILSVTAPSSAATTSLFAVASSTKSTIFNVLGSGNVGIGTASPNAKLTVISPDTTSGPGFSLRQSNNNAYGFDFDTENVSVGRLDTYGVNNGTRTLLTSLVRDTGRFGIGTNNPAAPLQIKASGATSGNVIFNVTSTNSDANFTLTSASGNQAYFFQRDGATGVAGMTGPNGVSMDIYGGTNSFFVGNNDGSAAFGGTITSHSTFAGASLVATASGKIGIASTSPNHTLSVGNFLSMDSSGVFNVGYSPIQMYQDSFGSLVHLTGNPGYYFPRMLNVNYAPPDNTANDLGDQETGSSFELPVNGGCWNGSSYDCAQGIEMGAQRYTKVGTNYYSNVNYINAYKRSTGTTTPIAISFENKDNNNFETRYIAEYLDPSGATAFGGYASTTSNSANRYDTTIPLQVSSSTATTVFAVDSTPRTHIFSVLGNGNVGIGTSSPTNDLVILGKSGQNTALRLVNTGTGNTSEFSMSAAGISGTGFNFKYYGSAIGSGLNNTAELWNFNSSGNSGIRVGGSGGELARFDTINARLGIGTTSPSQKLDVNGNINLEGAANGIIMHDTATASCYLVQITNGVLTPTAHACQ